MSNRQPQLIMAGIAVFCFCLLAYAWFLQYGPEKQQPCPLCVLQRFAYILVGLVALAGALHRHLTYPLVGMVIADAGFGLALWQVLKGDSMTSCQRDPVGIFVNSLPTADLFPEYFFASGGCADKYITLGLPVPVWSLICFGLLSGLMIFVGIRMYQEIRRNNQKN